MGTHNTHRAEGAPVIVRSNAAQKERAAKRRSGRAMARALTLLAVGAVAGTGMAGASTQSAEAAGTVWDRVAQCESGGRWHINTGRYDGGLQFSASTWAAYGGRQYAPTADRATKAQQIAIAQRTLAGQGPGAWPVCSKRAGLTRANGGANRHAVAGKSAPAPKKAAPKKSAPKKAAARSGRLAVDGRFGPATTRKLQRWIGVPQDGHMSSSDIRALQRKIGAKPDGKWGSSTTRKLQQKMGLRTTGVWDLRKHRASTAALQQKLNGR